MEFNQYNVNQPIQRVMESLNEDFEKIESLGLDDISGQEVLQTISKTTGITNAKEYEVAPSKVVGSSDSIQAMIDACRAETLQNTDTLEKQHTIILESGIYLIDKEIKLSPYVKLKPMGKVEFKLTHNGTALWLAPSDTDPVYLWNHPNISLAKQAWSRGEIIDGSNGALVFTNGVTVPQNTENKTVAIEIGNRPGARAVEREIARYVLSHVSIFGYNTAIKMNTFNNYIGTFKHIFSELNTHHFVWGDPAHQVYNSGENFTFENCIFAGGKPNSFLFHHGAIDVTFENTSFDFNASPIFNIKSSGLSLRLSNSYVEMIGNGTTEEQLLFKGECVEQGAIGGRSTVYLHNTIMFLERPKRLIRNLPHPGSSAGVTVTLDITGLEMRYKHPNKPVSIDDAELVESADDIVILGKTQVPFIPHRAFVSKGLNLLGNGDFSKSTVGSTATNLGPFWEESSIQHATSSITAEGINNTKSLKVQVTTQSNHYSHFTYGFNIPATAGQIVTISPSIKVPDGVATTLSIQSLVECYDASGQLIDAISHYTGLTQEGTPIPLTGYHYPNQLSVLVLPAGTASFKPGLIFGNVNHNYYLINDIQVNLLG